MPVSLIPLSKAAMLLILTSLVCFTGATFWENYHKTYKTSVISDNDFERANPQNSAAQAQIFVQTLTTIMTGFEESFNTLLATTYTFDFYIKNQTLTNETIFMFNNTVTPDTSIQLWNDPQYGWSSPSTLINWVALAIGSGYSCLNPHVSPEYFMLKNHFNLTDDQMFALSGCLRPGQIGQTSVLYELVLAVQSTISQENNCAMPAVCSMSELIILQFDQAKLTKYPPFDGISGVNSIADLNQTYPVAPEIAAVNTGGVFFGSYLMGLLLSPLSQSSQLSLFNASVVQLIIDNQNNPSVIVSTLGLDDTAQAQVLIDYVNYVLNQFAYQGQANSALVQGKANDIVSNMNNLMLDIANLTSINLTAIGTFNYMQNQGKTCNDILQSVNVPSNIITNICSNPEFTLDTAQGQAPWIAAYNAGVGSSMYAFIEAATSISDDNLQTLLSITSEFGGAIDMVNTAFANSFGCAQVPCDGSFISALQWAEAGVTRNLPREYFNQTYSSLADIFPEHFEGYFPEFPAFTSKYLGVMVSLSLDQAMSLLSYDVGSLNNNYEVFRFLTMQSNNDYDDIQTRFGLTRSVANDMVLYFDSGLPHY